MKWLTRPLLWALLAAVVGSARADDAADKAAWQAQVDTATQSIAAGGSDLALFIAYYNRAWGYNDLQDLDKASNDASSALTYLQKLPMDNEEAGAWVQLWNLKGEIAVEREQWKEASDALEAVQKRENFALVLKQNNLTGLYYYNLSRAYAHTDYPYGARANATHAADYYAARTGDNDKRMHSLSLRQRAIALYGEGDLSDANSDWAAAKLLNAKLGEAPFDPLQAALNKAVNHGSEKERIARARYLLTHAYDVHDDQLDLDILDDPDPEFGGTLSLADATAPVATPLSLATDALYDLDTAVRIVGDTQGLQMFDIALERGRGRAFVFQLDPDGKRFSAHQVDEELNRAVKLRPFDMDARRARADWLVYRLDNLNEMAKKTNVDIANREEARANLLYAANDDLARILLANRADVSHHVDRARLLTEQPDKAAEGQPLAPKAPYLDPNTLAYDINSAAHAPSPDDSQGTADHLWAVVHNILPPTTAKPAGTALEWKEKAKAANAARDTDTALEDLNKALAIDPNFADALNNRGTVYIARAQWDVALRDFDAAIGIDPKHRVAYMNRAVLKMDVGDFDGSVADARQSVIVAPDDTIKTQARKGLLNSLYARADALSEKKETLAGAYDGYHEGNALAASLKLPPDSKWLQYEGTMAAQIGRGPDALSALRAAHAAKPDDVWVEGWLTVVATALNEPDAATLEQEISQRGDYNTLSNIHDLANSLKDDKSRLTNQPEAEVARLEALRSRLYSAYRAKPGGRVIDGGDKTP